MLGSISTGTDEDEGNYKNVVEDDEDFCTYLNGGSCNQQGDQTCVLTPPISRGRTAAATGQSCLKHLCTTAVPQKRYWYEATLTPELF